MGFRSSFAAAEADIGCCMAVGIAAGIVAVVVVAGRAVDIHLDGLRIRSSRLQRRLVLGRCMPWVVRWGSLGVRRPRGWLLVLWMLEYE